MARGQAQDTDEGRPLRPPFPPEAWVVERPFDASIYLDRGPVRYEDDPDAVDGSGPWPEGVPLPDEG